MDKESLIKAREMVLRVINGLDILDYDKIELLINLNIYLNPENYEDDTKVLMKEFFKRREHREK